MLLLHQLLAKINFSNVLATFCYCNCFWKKLAALTKKLEAETEKWSAETKSDFITTFFLTWPSKKVLDHKTPGIKKLLTKNEKYSSHDYLILPTKTTKKFLFICKLRPKTPSKFGDSSFSNMETLYSEPKLLFIQIVPRVSTQRKFRFRAFCSTH